MKKLAGLIIIFLIAISFRTLMPLRSYATSTASSKTNPSTLHKPTPTVTATVLQKPSPTKSNSATFKKVVGSKTPSKTPQVKINGEIPAAEVTGVKGNTLMVKKNGKTYTIQVLSSTLFRKHYWGSTTLSQTAVGDKINITGVFTNTNKTTMQATLVRNLSILQRRGVTFGIIASVSGLTIKLQPKNLPLQTVTLTSKTKLVERTEKSISAKELRKGDEIRVSGLWDRGSNTITDVTLIKDFTLPQKATTSAEKQ